MKVIIQKPKTHLGNVGDIIEVADGYAANYLLPKKIVLPAYQGNEKIVQENIRQASAKKALIKQQAIQLAAKMKQKTIVVKVKAADKGKIFGNITPLQIATAINEKISDINLTHEQIILNEAITELGKHNIILKLHQDVQTDVSVDIQAA